MRSRRHRSTERYPVLADEPVEIHRPRRKVRLIALSFTATIALAGGAAYAGTAYAIDRADSGLRHSRDQFTADLEQRRREQKRQQVEMNQDLCTVVTRLPVDPETDAMRRKYGCGPFVPAAPDAPVAAPSPAAPPKAGTSAPGAPPAARPRSGPTPTTAPPPPHGSPPAPPPQPPPQPPAQPPDDPGGLLRVCLPLLGCVMV